MKNNMIVEKKESVKEKKAVAKAITKAFVNEVASQKEEEKKMEEAKKEATVKAEEKKETSKKTPVNKTDAKKATVEKKVTTAKKEATPKKAEVIEEVYVQYANQEVPTSVLVDKVKAAYIAEGHKADSIKKVRVYIKPEENMLYYVVNDDYASGISLF